MKKLHKDQVSFCFQKCLNTRVLGLVKLFKTCYRARQEKFVEGLGILLLATCQFRSPWNRWQQGDDFCYNFSL